MRDRVRYPRKDKSVEINVLAAEPEIDAAVADIPEAPLEGEGAAAAELRAGIEALRKATEHERQQAQPQQQEPPSLDAMRAAQIELWQQQGLPAQDAAFLKKHLEMVSYPALAQHAAAEVAAAGLQPGTEEFYSATAHRFSHHMDQVRRQNQDQNAAIDVASGHEPEPRLEAQPAPVVAAPQVITEGAVPEQPRPARAAPAARVNAMADQDPSSFVSAPVSRQIPSPGRSYATDPRSVHLSADERLIAKASGLTDSEYARLKLRLEAEKAQGLHQR